MKNLALSTIFDTAFSVFIIFLLLFCIFNLFIPKPFSYIIAITLSLLIGLLIFKFLHRKKLGLTNSEKKAKLIDEEISKLNYYTTPQTLELFKKALENNGKQLKVIDDCLFIEKESLLIYPKFSFDGINKAEIVKLYNLIKMDKNIEIYSQSFSSQLVEFCNKFSNVTLKDSNDSYALLEQANCLPEQKLGCSKEKNRKEMIKSILKREHSKKFFGFGIFFILSSNFSPFKFYYLIVGLLMLLFSTFTLIFGKR